jgi:hypothetical protein
MPRGLVTPKEFAAQPDISASTLRAWSASAGRRGVACGLLTAY